MRSTARDRVLRVTVVGNPGLDTLVQVAEEHIDLRADGHFVHNVDTVGHAPAFVARDLARLGHRVRILGAVGEDPIGRMVTDVLAGEGVSTDLLFTDPTGTPRSVNIVFPSGRRTFFYDGGSHMTLRPPQALVDSALAETDLVVAALPNWGRDVVARAREGGIPVAVDLQDVRDPDDEYRADFVAAADHLFASAAHLDDPAGAADRWLAAGPAATVVLGLGGDGALVVERGTDGHTRRLTQPPASGPGVGDLPIVDTTGAGDALASGFLDGVLSCDLDPVQAALRGQVLARIVCSDLGGAARFDRPLLERLCAQV